MSEHYRYRKDKTHLSSKFKLRIDSFFYLNIYIWNSHEGMRSNILDDGDPEWIDGYDACYLAMKDIEMDDEKFLPKLFGEIHLVLNNFGVGIIAHELTHFLLNWMRAFDITDDEPLALVAGDMNKKFWNAFYKRYELVDGVWER